MLERRGTGTTTRQARTVMHISAGGLLVPMTSDPGTGPRPICEHRIALDDGLHFWASMAVAPAVSGMAAFRA